MGYNTTVLFLNDAVHNIKTDEKFSQKLYDSILCFDMVKRQSGILEFSIGNHLNGGAVIAQDHADITNVIAVGQNSFNILTSSLTNITKEKILLQDIADKLGYRLVKKNKS